MFPTTTDWYTVAHIMKSSIMTAVKSTEYIAQTEVWFDFLLQHSWLPLKRPMINMSFIKNLVIVTCNQLLMVCGTGSVWISGSVALAGQQCFWGVAVRPAVFGCCFVWAAAGGLRPWVYVACEPEPFWHTSSFPWDMNDQVSVLRSSCIMKCCVVLYLWPTLHGTHRYRVHKINTARFYSCYATVSIFWSNNTFVNGWTNMSPSIKIARINLIANNK